MGDKDSPESFAAAGGMKLNLSPGMLSAAAVTVLLLVSFFLWTLPFQNNRLPFGEGDSAWHFAIGDNTAHNDKATFRLPYYVGMWYYNFNSILGPFAPEYPPSNHVNYALMQVFGGERFVPVFIYRAIASFLGVFAVFFVIFRLFGTLPAFLAGLGLVFSFREQMIFLWGQQPTLVSLVIVPVVLYSWYSYLSSFYSSHSSSGGGSSGKSGEKIAYLYITFALLASQFLLHLQGFMAGLLVIGIFTALMVGKFRRLPLARSNFVHFAAAMIAFSVVAAPFVLIYLGAPHNPPPVSSFERLSQWNVPHKLVTGSFPESFVLFSYEYAPVVRFFLFGGILLLVVRALLVRPNQKELLLVGWLVGLYVIFHLDVLGIIDPGRVARMQVMEPPLFFSLAALSVVWLPSTISSLIKVRSRAFPLVAAKYFLASVLVISILSSSGKASYDNLKNAYGGIERITPLQAEFAESLNGLVPESAYVYDPSVKIVGQWRYPKMRWMLAISQRHVGRYDGGPIAQAASGDFDKDKIYFLFDYSDIALFASSPQYQQQAAVWASQLQQLEQQMFNSTKPLYDAGNIRLYKYEGPWEVAA